MELNVKQHGISHRVINFAYRKTRNGKIVKRTEELYIRNDISCGFEGCSRCDQSGKQRICHTGELITNIFPRKHAAFIEATALIRFCHLLEDPRFMNIIISQSVWEEVKGSSPPTYKVMNGLCYESNGRGFFVFMDNLHQETHISRRLGDSTEKTLERSLLTSAKFYKKHWEEMSMDPIVLVASIETRDRLRKDFPDTFTFKEYVEGMKDNSELLAKVNTYEKEAAGHGRMLFPVHLSPDGVQDGLRCGTLKRATFQVSRENYLEAFVHVDEGVSWFIEGRVNANRAVNGDVVAVQLLPVDQWSTPKKIIRLRDVEEMERKGDVEVDDEEKENAENTEPELKKARVEDRLPSARVVAIVKRNWRQYCGIILESAIPGAGRVLFAPAERVIPRIRIESKHADELRGKRVLVAIDHWPRDSRYPVGHYVRTIGTLGDRDTENEVLLLEHDVPHSPFADAVLACLPSMPWVPPVESHRKDLRSLCICSVDPPGCTDIDDALHCVQISPQLFEAGVHIADVTHFVRPGTAMDEEASQRGTTVYLCDKRIDMLPDLLSSNLCSLRENEDRFAFSVVWKLTAEADIVSVTFQKSIIRSRGALTYEIAQNKIDDSHLTDPLTTSLRGLMALSKKLKEKRRAKGALSLASSEIRFNIDSETRDPISVLEKKHLETNSMVEEFMLLANISVAERICSEYPDCALLRRHPVPPAENYKPVIEAAQARGFAVNVNNGKSLSESLDAAVDKSNPMLNTLIRMLTTRCMTQAVYFSSGSLPSEQYVHFGLAAPIYTHFTSPIRRYADVMVHRLLAAAINADTTFPTMLRGDYVSNIANNLNYRHKQAQYAGRASVLLNTLLYFKGRCELHDGFVMGVRKNGIQVFVPKYGFESVVVFPQGMKYTVTEDSFIADDVCVRAFQRVQVQLSLNEKDVQHVHLEMKLVKPTIPGFSVDFILSAPED